MSGNEDRMRIIRGLVGIYRNLVSYDENHYVEDKGMRIVRDISGVYKNLMTDDEKYLAD